MFSPGLENLIPDYFMLTQNIQNFFFSVFKGGSVSRVGPGLDFYSIQFLAFFVPASYQIVDVETL